MAIQDDRKIEILSTALNEIRKDIAEKLLALGVTTWGEGADLLLCLKDIADSAMIDVDEIDKRENQP